MYEFTSKPNREYADEIDNIVSKFKTHLRIVKKKKHFKINSTFSFSPTSKDKIIAIIKDFQNNKAAVGFLGSLKNANITPFYKKDDLTDKVNYHSVSVFPLQSKTLERVIYNKLRKYMDLFLNKLSCGFRKAHSTQHALFKLLHIAKKSLITRVLLAHWSWTALKRMTAYHMTILLQGLKLMVQVRTVSSYYLII